MPMHRRGSAPLPYTAPPNVGNNTPKCSSSIKSITITSRMVSRSNSLPDINFPTQLGSRSPNPMDLNKHVDTQYFRQAPQRQAIAVKITEQRKITSTITQPKVKNGHICSLPLRCNTINGYSPCFMSNIQNRRSPDPVCVGTTENQNKLPVRGSLTPKPFDMSSRESHSPISKNLTTVDTHQPVILRKTPTIIHIKELKENYSRCTNEDGRILKYRHSYTEGLKDTSSQDFHNCPSSIEDTVSGSLMKLVKSNGTNRKETERYKSTFTLKLNYPSSPSSTEPLMNEPNHNRRPMRPASCYATFLNPSEHSVNTSKYPEIQSRSVASPLETNIDCSGFAGSGSNKYLQSEREASSHEKIYLGRSRSATNVGQRDIPGNQHLTLIKVPESSTHETYDAIIALNAAAVIANIKLQSQQRKQTQTHGSTNNNKDSAYQHKTARCKAEETHTYNQDSATLLSIAKSETAAWKPWNVEFFPLATTDELSSYTYPLSKALEQSRPDFIRRSQARVQAVEKRAQKRHHLINKQTQAQAPAQDLGDNTIKSHKQSTLGNQMQSQLKRKYIMPEVKRIKEEKEKRMSVYKTNRLRAELFKKKVLDQVLRRGNK